ncbi:MAG: hypothetical protein AB7O13_24740 [Alphaproteobacteria bacterium]
MTNPLPSILEPVVDRNRRWNPLWYRFIKPLLESVNTAENAIASVVTAIDNLAGTWGVSVNVNNRVTAAVKLDGSATTSSFAVLATKFIIVHPTDDDDVIQAFVVGQVDGVETVGINGDLVVDGSILARHIDVASLSALSADIGTVTAGVLQSADGNFVIDLDNKTITITT